LHVTEAFNGGIVEVLRAVISSSKSQNNMLLFASHEYDPLPDLEDDVFKAISTVRWERGHLNRILQLKRVIKTFNPDVVHLHSSWAGLYGRLIFRKKHKIFYSAHGFGFQKKDVGGFLRFIFFLTEGILQLRTDANVSFWPLEVSLFSKLGGKRKTYFCPELISFYFTQPSVELEEVGGVIFEDSLKVIGLGRLTKAKDPTFFCDVVSILKTRIRAEYVWVGDGDAHFRALLNKAHILISGWLPPDEVLGHVREASVTLITSSWDGGPSSLYQSISLGTPVAARDFPAASILGITTGKTPAQVAEICVQTIEKASSSKVLADQENRIREAVASLNPIQILDCYNIVVDGQY
jgi:hypothetical protein